MNTVSNSTERSAAERFDAAHGGVIRFAVGASSLGLILVAASDKGIIAILLGDGHDALLRELRKRFPKARFSAGGAAFVPLVTKVVDFVDAPGVGSICRSTSGEPPSSNASGRCCARSRPGRR